MQVFQIILPAAVSTCSSTFRSRKANVCKHLVCDYDHCKMNVYVDYWKIIEDNLGDTNKLQQFMKQTVFFREDNGMGKKVGSSSRIKNEE